MGKVNFIPFTGQKPEWPYVAMTMDLTDFVFVTILTAKQEREGISRDDVEATLRRAFKETDGIECHWERDITLPGSELYATMSVFRSESL